MYFIVLLRRHNTLKTIGCLQWTSCSILLMTTAFARLLATWGICCSYVCSILTEEAFYMLYHLMATAITQFYICSPLFWYPELHWLSVSCTFEVYPFLISLGISWSSRASLEKYLNNLFLQPIPFFTYFIFLFFLCFGFVFRIWSEQYTCNRVCNLHASFRLQVTWSIIDLCPRAAK